MSHDVRVLAQGVRERVIELQREIHADPEIGFETHRTAAKVARELRDAGIVVREGVGRTGVLGDLEAPAASRRIAFRADMDALPMEEESDLPHRSQNPGAAHLCGHDAHTAMLLGAARALSPLRESLSCSVRFIFQPNEESLPGGAPAMIEDGCLEGVDRIFGLHVWPLLDTGRIGILHGPALARPDTWRIRLTGKGGHAAAPHETHDPIIAAAHIVTALQTIVSRNVDPLQSAVLSVTRIEAGTADNVIPSSAALGGTIRSFATEVAEGIRDRMAALVSRLAQAFAVEAAMEFTEGYPVLVNDAGACDEAEAILKGHIETSRNVDPSLGGEDFAYYLAHVPGAFLFLGNRNLAKGIRHFCHHPRFQVDDDALEIGVQTWLALALGTTGRSTG